MSDNEDTVFVECSDGVASYATKNGANEHESSVEVLGRNSEDTEVTQENKAGEREDIIQASEAVKSVKGAIQYQDDQSLQDALDKVKAYAHIDAEFQEKISMLERIRNTENYAPFREVVEEALLQLTDAQEKAKQGQTTLSRPIEILSEVIPVFETACSVCAEKFEDCRKVNEILMQIDAIREDIKKCEDVTKGGDVESAKKLERKCEKLLQEAVTYGTNEVERIKEKIRKEEETGILTWFETTRTETNKKMDYLTDDFEQMKNSCADDIQLAEKTLKIEIESKEAALVKFQRKDEQLDEEIAVEVEKEEELKRQLKAVQERRRILEEDKELRRAVQDRADVVHGQAEADLIELQGNLNELLTKVDTANVVLKQTKDVCNTLFNKAVESKTMQNQDLESILLIAKKNKHSALIAQGVNCMHIKEREQGTIDILKAKIKKHQGKLRDHLKRHLESDAKKASTKIAATTSELEAIAKSLAKVEEKLTALKQEIAEVQKDLGLAGTQYYSLEHAYNEFKSHNECDDGYSLPSMS